MHGVRVLNKYCLYTEKRVRSRRHLPGQPPRVPRVRKKLINNDEFILISNNCWGANVYQSWGIPYKSPTIGIDIMADDYIKIIGNLRYYMGIKLGFVKPKESKHYNELSHQSNFGSYPVGKLNDIELMLLHYTSEEEA